VPNEMYLACALVFCYLQKKRIVAFVRIGDEEVKDGAAEKHVHNVEEGCTEDVPGFTKNAEMNKKLWFERVNRIYAL
jgi:hypothetical protein